MAVEEAKTLEECCRRLREKLDGCFERNDHIDSVQKRFERFAPRGKTLEVFDQDRLKHLLLLLLFNGSTDSHRLAECITKMIRGSEDSRPCCNFLAVLIYSDCKRQHLIDFVELLLSEEPRRPYADDDLPLTEDAASEHFGDLRTFWEHQYLFCPVILKGQEENIYKGHRQSCPLPFVKEPEKIGQGAYAIVYKVVIAKGHLTNDESFNDQHEYAMKQFAGYNAEVKKSFDDEGTTIKQIIQSVRGHRNIATTRASLEWGNTYRLFFDLAERNLWQHFMEDRDPVKTLEERQRVFSRIRGLAGALAHLHEGLKLYPTNEPLQCYHLDLKPQNILVFGTGDYQIWKISDFGMSQIKQIQPMESQHEPKHHLLDRIFQSTKPGDDPSSGVDNSRYGGTYAAPEAKEKSDTVTRKSDVWSLGCVITLLITYLHAQSQGIKQFERLRASDRSQDWFFDPKAYKTGSDNSVILHSSVLEWFQILIEGGSRRGQQEAKTIGNTIDLLRDEIFLRDEENRLSAKKVEEKLETLYSFKEQIHSQDTSTQRKPIMKISIPRLKLLHHLKWPAKIASPHGPWQLNGPHPSKRSRFSADGRYLGIASNDIMRIQPVASIRGGQVGRSFKSQEDRPWADFSIGSEYLCAALNSEYFEFVYMHLSSEEDIEKFDRDMKLRCKIRRVVLSPNDQITAFVLEGPRHGNKNLRVAIYRTQDLLDESISSQPSAMTHRSSSPPRFSIPASELEDLPWKNILESSQTELPIGAQLADLKFSSDSSILMGITEVFVRQQDPRYQYEIFTWDIATGRRFPSIRPPITSGFDDMRVSWEIKTFAVLSNKLSFAAMSKIMIRWGSYEPPEYTVKSRRMGYELLDILVPDEEEHVVLLARPNGSGHVSAFRVSTNKIGGLESLGDGISIGTNHYDRNRDCCCLVEKDDRLVIMLVNIGKDGGTLYEKCLEW